MSLLALRNGIVNHTKTAFQNLKTCEGHAGRFDAAELKRIGMKAPGIFIACMGYSDLSNELGGTIAPIQWAAFIVTRDVPNAPRDQSALLLANAFALELTNQRWGMEGSVSVPDQVRGTNLYSAEIDRDGVAMWAVSWRQQMDLGNKVDWNQLSDLLLMSGSHYNPGGIAAGQAPLASDEAHR